MTNALADPCTRRDVKDRAVAITVEYVEGAKETIIRERRTPPQVGRAEVAEDLHPRAMHPQHPRGLGRSKLPADSPSFTKQNAR